MEGEITEKEKERMAKASTYPWAEAVENFEMTKEERQDADNTLLRLMKEFEVDKK